MHVTEVTYSARHYRCDQISQADTIILIDGWLELVLLSSIDRLGVKVALSINRNRLFHSGANGGIHIVRWQSSSYGTEARHSHLE